jgi:hypothetical protein
MKKLSIPPDLQEKIYDLKINDTGVFLKITTYFPLHPKEKQEILKAIDQTKKSPVNFKSIFSDKISELEWNNSKEQIKKKFQDELMELD